MPHQPSSHLLDGQRSTSHHQIAKYPTSYTRADTASEMWDNGFSQVRFEPDMEESEMKRRMMMESSMNLEVDLSSLGMDERPEVSRRTFPR